MIKIRVKYNDIKENSKFCPPFLAICRVLHSHPSYTFVEDEQIKVWSGDLEEVEGFYTFAPMDYEYYLELKKEWEMGNFDPEEYADSTFHVKKKKPS
jgi:hypothetical protein